MPSISGCRTRRPARNAEASRFIEAVLFRRYAAKLRFELAFWDRFPADGGTSTGYSELLTQATGIRYPTENFLADMDAGFYSADYLRAWIRVGAAPAASPRRDRRELVALTRDRRAPARALPRRDAPVERGDREAAGLRPARHRAPEGRALCCLTDRCDDGRPGSCRGRAATGPRRGTSRAGESPAPTT